MTPTNNDPHSGADRELLITRLLDAPRELVFSMFTDPVHLAQWWGPHGFTNPVCEIDARPGGTCRIVMRAPDGTEFPTTFVYQEIAVPERIVYSSQSGPAPPSLTTLSFEDRDGKTLLTIHTLFQSTTDRDTTVAMGHVQGMNQSLDRLAAQLARQTARS